MDDLRDFLAVVDTAFLATASADGQPYVQHRGGPPGFIRVIDEDTIGFVDIVGNRQYLTTGNLEENDRVCLIAIDYEQRRRVKIWGRMRAVPLTDALLAELMPAGYRKGQPDKLMLLRVARYDWNCPAHIPRKVNAR